MTTIDDPTTLSPPPITTPTVTLSTSVERYVGRIYRHRLVITGPGGMLMCSGWYDGAVHAVHAGREWAEINGYRVDKEN